MADVAVISGGTGGLGRAVTKAFLAAGWRCVVPYRNAEAAAQLEREAASAQLELICADLTAEEEAGAVVERASAAGRVGAVLNLAGGFDAPGPIDRLPWERFSAQLELNLRTAYQLTRQALPKLLEGGGGSVVYVSSRAALHPFGGAAGYITAKRGVVALAELVALEYGKLGVRSNCLVPAVIDTEANRKSQPTADRSGWTPPERIAAVCLWLCSPQAEAVNGAAIPV